MKNLELIEKYSQEKVVVDFSIVNRFHQCSPSNYTVICFDGGSKSPVVVSNSYREIEALLTAYELEE